MDPSAALLGDLEAALAAETAEVRGRVRLVQGEAERLADLVPRGTSTRSSAMAC